MKGHLFVASIIVLLAGSVVAEEEGYPKAKVNFDDYKFLVAEVEAHRARRLIDLDTFLAMSKKPGVMILDARSSLRYERIHVKGARHLSFTDFTQGSLASVIPSFDTTILIYCNNNFQGDQVDFMSKVGPARRFLAEPLMLALNIPTYINLYGYGYRDIYELNELVGVTDPRIDFEGSTITPARAAAD